MGKVGWGWKGRFGWRARHDFTDNSSEERDLDLERQMMEADTAIAGILERASERKRGLKFGGGLFSKRKGMEGPGIVRRGRERVEWENRIGW